MDVAPCKPFSNMMDTAEIVACSFLVDSMVTASCLRYGVWAIICSPVGYNMEVEALQLPHNLLTADTIGIVMV